MADERQCFVSNCVMKLTDFSEIKASQTVVLCKQGLTQVAIARYFGVNQSTIQRCLVRHRKTGTYKNFWNECGRKQVTSTRTDNMIHRMAVADPSVSSSCIVARLPDEVQVSSRTIRRRLHDEFILKAYRPAAKPKLSAKNIKDRIKFCRKYQNWTNEEWKSDVYR